MSLHGAKILVTGASGFIGSFVVELALERGAEVWAAVRPTSSRRYLADERIRFVELDLGSDERLGRQLAEHKARHGAWDYVVHAAGATKCVDVRDFQAVNTEGTRRLATLLRDGGMVTTRFVFLSSLSAFGAIRETPVAARPPYYAPIREDDVPQPNTAYGRSKLAAEQALAALKDFPCVTLRPTGVYGPRERDYYLMARCVARHLDFAVGYRPQEITFVYVRDLAEAVLLAAERGVNGRAYFVSDGGVYDSRAFAELVQRELGLRHVGHVRVPVVLLHAVCAAGESWGRLTKQGVTLNLDKFRILKQRNWQCDISPIQRDLGFSPRYSLEQGVKETVAWYKQEKWL